MAGYLRLFTLFNSRPLDLFYPDFSLRRYFLAISKELGLLQLKYHDLALGENVKRYNTMILTLNIKKL